MQIRSRAGEDEFRFADERLARAHAKYRSEYNRGDYGAFFGDLLLRYVDGRTWQVVNTKQRLFGYIFPDSKKADPVAGRRCVPANEYRTDLASTHFVIVRWLLPSAGDGERGAYGPAAVVHDWIYKTKKVDGIDVSRRLADRAFYWGMRQSGVARWRCQMMYRAVRAAGWWYWHDVNKKLPWS